MNIEKKAVHMIEEALGTNEREGEIPPHDEAEAIEKALLKLYGSCDNPQFRSKVRSIVFNLKDPKNQILRRQLLDGAITAEQLVHLSPHEMANPELQEEYKEMEEEYTREFVVKNPEEEELPDVPSDLERAKHHTRIDFLTATAYRDEFDPTKGPPRDEHEQRLQSL